MKIETKSIKLLSKFHAKDKIKIKKLIYLFGIY